MCPPACSPRLTADGHQRFTARLTPSVLTWCHLAIRHTPSATPTSVHKLPKVSHADNSDDALLLRSTELTARHRKWTHKPPPPCSLLRMTVHAQVEEGKGKVSSRSSRKARGEGSMGEGEGELTTPLGLPARLPGGASLVAKRKQCWRREGRRRDRVPQNRPNCHKGRRGEAHQRVCDMTSSRSCGEQHERVGVRAHPNRSGRVGVRCHGRRVRHDLRVRGKERKDMQAHTACEGAESREGSYS